MLILLLELQPYTQSTDGRIYTAIVRPRKMSSQQTVADKDAETSERANTKTEQRTEHWASLVIESELVLLLRETKQVHNLCRRNPTSSVRSIKLPTSANYCAIDVSSLNKMIDGVILVRQITHRAAYTSILTDDGLFVCLQYDYLVCRDAVC